MNFKKWNIAEVFNEKEIKSKYNLSAVASRVAASRIEIIGEEDIFANEYLLYSPFDLKDMDRAVERINAAIENGEKICVYGDYDTDGITATAIVYSYLDIMGADVCYYIPLRAEEGYGLNVDAIDSLKHDGVELIITVDNGISSVDEIDYAKSIGIDVVVTDHHKPQETLPNCIAVDPHRKDCKSAFKDICGAAVAFKLVTALENGDYDSTADQYIELVAIATVADIVPLLSENRTFVKLGVQNLSFTDNIGLKALLEHSLSENSKIDATTLAFSVVPRINAAGRMGDAKRALRLLITDDINEAESLCLDICDDNIKRKKIETEIIEEIDNDIMSGKISVTDRVIVAYGENWHYGVLGIVASKLIEKYSKPAIVLNVENGEANGSGRSVEGFSLFDAIASQQHLLKKFGGHSNAAGVTIPQQNILDFIEGINEYAKENYPFMPLNTLEIDAEISPLEINLAALKELSLFAPFGKGNSEPVFAIKNLKIENIQGIGGGKHTRIYFSKDKVNFNAVCFGVTTGEIAPYSLSNVDIAVKLSENVYNDIVSVSIKIVDIRPTGIDDKLFFSEKQLFENLIRGEEITNKQANYIMPSYNEAGEVYRYISKKGVYNNSIDMLYIALNKSVNRAKLEAIVTAFCQCGLIKKENGKYSIVATDKKADLFNCQILSTIKGYQNA